MKKYMLIYNDIYNKIREKSLKAGDKLPSEKDLMKIYGVSRYTVRNAIKLLEDRGFVQKKQGSQTSITNRDPLRFPISEILSFKELSEIEGLNAITHVENLEIIKDRDLMYDLFSIDKNEEIIKLVRTREIDGARVILDIDYFRRQIINNLPLKEAKNSTYRYIEEDLGIEIGYAVKQFYAEPPTQKAKELLDLKDHNLLIVVKSDTFLSNNTIFQHTISYHRPDKFKFIDISKRHL